MNLITKIHRKPYEEIWKNIERGIWVQIEDAPLEDDDEIYIILLNHLYNLKWRENDEKKDID